jgi:hypothetical protein
MKIIKPDSNCDQLQHFPPKREHQSDAKATSHNR